jgi:cell division protein FtsI (penicillin-binding protein 3)
MAEVRYKGRIALLAAAILTVFTGIGARLASLHLRPAEWVSEPIREGRMLEQKPVGNRGRIVDRNGQILAMDLASYHITVDPRDIARNGDPEAVIRCLTQEFHIPPEELRPILADTDRQYVRVRKYVPGQKVKRFDRRSYGVSYTPGGQVEGSETNVYIRGLKLEEVPIRNYPKGALMAHVVGFSNRDGKGSAGVEYRMNELLKGTEGLRVSKKDGRRREIYSTRKIITEPADGANVMLTLDQQLQYVTEKTIEKMCGEFNARAAWAIVMQVRTGEILAMASYPTYDLNRYGKAPDEWRRNRAISFNYEPGSTMKAALIASALEHGIVATNDMIDCENGYWVYGGKALRDSHGEGIIPVQDVIKFSSNIGTAKIALEMGDQLVYDSLKAFHFGERLGLDIPGEETGILNSLKDWSKISITRVGMGHEIGVTALQIVSMINTIACNGVQMKPWIIKRVTAPDGTVLQEYGPEELGRPLSPSTARSMRGLLARVTEEEGTGVKAAVEGYRVAGKTGTAQKIRPPEEGGGYYSKNFISSFVGFLPAENPEISIIVVADDPGEYTESGRKIKYYGGTVCGPAFKEIAEFAVRYLRISPDGDRVYVARPES